MGKRDGASSYYIDVVSCETVWKRPSSGVIYQRIASSDGRPYFLNLNDNSSSWTVPESIKAFVESRKLNETQPIEGEALEEEAETTDPAKTKTIDGEDRGSMEISMDHAIPTLSKTPTDSGTSTPPTSETPPTSKTPTETPTQTPPNESASS